MRAAVVKRKVEKLNYWICDNGKKLTPSDGKNDWIFDLADKINEIIDVLDELPSPTKEKRNGHN